MAVLILALLSLSLGSYQIKDLIRTYTIGDSTEVVEQATLQVKLVKSEPDEAFIYGLNAALMERIGLIKAFYGKDTSGPCSPWTCSMKATIKPGLRCTLLMVGAMGGLEQFPRTSISTYTSSILSAVKYLTWYPRQLSAKRS